MEEKKCIYKLIGKSILALGLAVGGFFPGYYYYQAQMNNNFVTVKGLAEMEVKADLAILEIKYVVTNDDLSLAQAEMNHQLQIIDSFFKKQGFEGKEISFGRIETNDLATNPYREKGNAQRYILSRSILVRSNKVDLFSIALQNTDSLVAQGVVFDAQSYGYPVSYMFTKLNDIKPQMLANATQNAKEAAQEFAKSSHSTVGKIRRAQQGVFSILPREQTPSASESQQVNKIVRVVSTIEYWLK